MTVFRLTPRALQDLRAIGRYTQKTWGKTQRDDYLYALDRRFAWLADHLGRGRRRNDIAEGYLCFPQGEHLIFRLLGEDGIDIIGIPHQSMDMVSYMAGEDLGR